MTISLKSRFIGCMLGLALGDAIGAPFEGSSQGIKSIDILPKQLRYTDDTEMAIGIAESLVEKGGLDPEHMSMRFVNNFDFNRGYGAGTISIINMLRNGIPWEKATRMFFPEGSFGNGSAMRVAPLGLFFRHDLQILKSATFITSAITHDHILAKEGSFLISLVISQITKNTPREKLLDCLSISITEEEYRSKLTNIRNLLQRNADIKEIVSILGHGVLALESVPTALYCFMKYGNSFLKTIKYCISLGGDTDTISAMSGAMVGTYLGREGLPEKYLLRLERKEEIEKLALLLYTYSNA